MPSTIPFHPSLALGSVVNPDLLENLKQISAIQGPAEAAQDTLNSLVQLKRSLHMTSMELVNMDVETGFLTEKIGEVKASIKTAAMDYAKARMDCETQSQALRAQAYGITSEVESPVDYVSSKVEKYEIGSDSLKLDSQYFSFSDEKQTSETMGKIKDFLSSALPKEQQESTEVVASSLEKINDHRMSNEVVGTLIITASCTHRFARMLAPFVMDPDKAVTAWNRTFPGDSIDIDDVNKLEETINKGNWKTDKTISLVSGAIYGSSFIGMVHAVKTSDSSQVMSENEVSSAMQKIEQALALQNASGGLLDPSLALDLMSLNKSSISAHVTILTVGVIPKIASTQMTDLGYRLAHPTTQEDDSKSDYDYGGRSNASSTQHERNHNRRLRVVQAKAEPVLQAADQSDTEKNKNLDMQTLVLAFDKYTEMVTEKKTSAGVPIHYFIKSVTKSDIARLCARRWKDEAEKKAKERAEED